MRNIRKKMIDIISREVSSTDLKDVVNKLIPDSIARDIEKACQGETSVNVVWSEKWWQIRHIEENTWSFWFARQADKYIKTLNLTYSGLDLKCNLELTLSGIYPLHDVHIRKVKVMKRPRFDLNKLMDMHGEGSGELLKSLSLNQNYPMIWFRTRLRLFQSWMFRQNCCDNRRCHRRGCGETRGIRASSAGVCLDYNVLMALNKAHWKAYLL